MSDIAVVGGGIVGLACARELLKRRPDHSLVVLERETEVAQHQTRLNSGVIHAGVYYVPGSLKARLCVEGARALYEYCDEKGIAAERCGKLIVATREEELPRLGELERRGHANGVPGLRRLDRDELREVEPHAEGMAALHSPNTGIVDFSAVATALRADIEAAGGRVLTGAEVTGIRRSGGTVELDVRNGHRGPTRGGAVEAYRGGAVEAHAGGTVRAKAALFCAGAAADRLAVLDGGAPDPRIVPFRGAYSRLRRPDLVRALVYPVPDPRLPFLGVHLTRHPSGDVLVGPTALLAASRRSLAWPGTWRVMRRFWRTGLRELRHATSRAAVAEAASRYVPGISADDLEPAFAGIRAQAIRRDGTLLDDFAFSAGERTLHVRNAPSPAATSSLAIASYVADRFDASL